MSNLTDLMRAQDDLCIVYWFRNPDVRPHEVRTPALLDEALLVARANAYRAGATEEQVKDCRDYARQLALRGRPPLALGMRTWDQFRKSLS